MKKIKVEEAIKLIKKMSSEEVHLGTLLYMYRIMHGQSKEDLATKLKTGISLIESIENNFDRAYHPSLDEVKRFAEVLEESEKYFLTVAMQDLLNDADLKYKVNLIENN